MLNLNMYTSPRVSTITLFHPPPFFFPLTENKPETFVLDHEYPDCFSVASHARFPVFSSPPTLILFH